MITSIELTNWKTHKHTVMNFQKGVNVLIGVMGAGKSSVIDGISFGLFGTFPSLNHKRTTTENLISNRPSVEDSAEVKIKFTLGNDEYSVTRKITRKESTSSKLEKNNSYIQTQTARVNEEIEALIKVNYDIFSRAIYAEQNRLDYFLELTKSDRKRQIDEMLGLDSFAVAESNTTSLINSIRSLISDEEQMLAQIDSSELKVQLEKMAREKAELEIEQKKISEDSREKEKSLKQLEKNMSDLKSKYDRSKKLTNEIAELSSKINTLNSELKKIESLGIDQSSIESEYASKSKRLELYQTELKSLRKEESSLQKIIAESEALVKLGNDKIKERDKLTELMKGKNIQESEIQIKNKEKELQDAMKELSVLKARKEEINEWVKELSKHISKCPLCERELDEKAKTMLLESKQSTIKETELSIVKIGENLSKLEKDMNELKKEQDNLKLVSSKLLDYKGLEEALAKNLKEANSGKEKHKTINDQIEKSSKESEALNKAINDLSVKIDSAKRKIKYDSDIKESSILLETRSKELKELDVNEKTLYSLQELITKESTILTDLNSKIKSNERYLNNLNSQIEDKAKAIGNVNLIQERIENRRVQISNMNKFRNALLETETQLRNNLVTSINALMQNIWSELYPYADYSGIRLNAKKDDYSLEASTGIDEKENRIWVEIEGIASGGEKSVACLTMRIALAMVIVPNLRWLILDEPTHNIDENGISKLIEVLSNSLPKVVEQIFIITHDNALKNISSARVYQLGRNKDKNEYTSVVEV
ncbi:MAG: AAA family ATPase [Candidatus Micrarchaeaceae archaeon]|jgi:DNA repair protein SbcC/Rad50